MLEKCIDAIRSQNKKKTVPWCLQTTPKVRFYKLLHLFLKKWTKTQQCTKSVIGLLYLAIDENFAGRRPDNVYRYVDSLSARAVDCNDLMSYSAKRQESYQVDCVSEMSEKISQLREQLDLSKQQLHATNCALRDITNEKLKVQKERDSALKKAARLKKSTEATREDMEHLIEEIENNTLNPDPSFGDDYEFLVNTAEITSENSQNSDGSQVDLTCRTKSGKAYSNSVRKLYYTLLSSGVPVSKIEGIVKDVVKWSHPSVDVSKLKIPKKSCASYMRQEELNVISTAHKATSLCSQLAAGAGLRINTDGTTKNQKNIDGVAINGMTICVNEVADGSASTAISNLSKELDKLRKAACALGIPNADLINWSMIESSTSDCAASQKLFNSLLLENKAELASCSSEASDEEVGMQQCLNFIENFCSIHLGVNLRKAFLSGMAATCQELNSSQVNSHPAVDTIVHQFCKVFGKRGTPEYGCGQQFPDFLKIMISEEKSISEQKLKYYQRCYELQLERQVGNRYFVTACNASKIIFLVPAALEFMEYTGKYDSGNKLEKELYQKLKDEEEIIQLLVDSLMYFHIYADLIMLSKSKQLNKSALLGVEVLFSRSRKVP